MKKYKPRNFAHNNEEKTMESKVRIGIKNVQHTEKGITFTAVNYNGDEAQLIKREDGAIDFTDNKLLGFFHQDLLNILNEELMEELKD